MQHYVVGLIFDQCQKNVLLIRKRRPSFQAGLLNGVGGKVEPHEHSHQAMQRECEEECGLHIQSWTLTACVCNREYQIDCYSAMADLSTARTCTDEPVEIHAVNTVFDLPSLPNLAMLIGIARDTSTAHKPIWIYE